MEEEDIISSNIKLLYSEFGQVYPNFQVFKQKMEDCNKDFGCLISMNSQNKMMDDKIYWYRSLNKPKNRVLIDAGILER